MSQIHVLSESVQNQIAAGEVVERPSSVLKELLDNAVDSGADHIEVEISQAGTELIRVTDNGSGIERDDLVLSTQRHATSKIACIDDLESLVTMGFRGEALASIASVSRFRITTATSTDDVGSHLVLDGEYENPVIQARAHPQGTTVAVRDLFYNVPVRREFMKSDKVEMRQILDVLKKFVLVQPSIATKLIVDEKERWSQPVANDEQAFRDRLEKIMPEGFAQTAIYQELEEEGLSVRAYFGSAQLTRSQADNQYLFVNGRAIKDMKLSYSCKRAYQELIFGQRHAMYIVWIQIDPSDVDVNVHPRKSEVRFKDPKRVHSLLFRACSRALSSKPEVRIPMGSSALNSPLEKLRTVAARPMPAAPSSPSVSARAPSPAAQAVLQSLMAQKTAPPVRQQSISEHSEVIQKPPIVQQSTIQTRSTIGYAIGQLAGIYILAQSDKGLVVVDMHAAHERILLEKYKKQYAESGVKKQNLLLPITVSVTEAELAIFEENKVVISHLGFAVVHTQDGLVISQIPVNMKLVATESVFRDILADFGKCDDAKTISTHINQMLATICCHNAVRKNRELSLQEMNQLLCDIEEVERSAYCNHGRPTWTVIPLEDFDQYFHRGE